MKYYHVSFEKVERFVPRVPEMVMEGEDSNTPRICVSTSVFGCLRSMPDGGLRLTGLHEIGKITIDRGAIPTFYIYTFEGKDVIDCLVPPEVLFEDYNVKDALYTSEHWITKEVPFREKEVQLLDCEHSLMISDKCGNKGIEIYDLRYSKVRGKDKMTVEKMALQSPLLKGLSLAEVYLWAAKERYALIGYKKQENGVVKNE